MKQSYLHDLSRMLDLGDLVTEPTQVFGGLLHTIWHIKTTTGEYAIKELNPTIMAQDNALKNYEFSEKIATLFYNHGIPALKGITKNNKAVTEIDGRYLIAYPWIHGTILSTNTAHKEYAQQIGTLLATIHLFAEHLPESLHATTPDVPSQTHSNAYLSELFDKASNDYSLLNNMRQELLALNQEYKKALTMLSTTALISHGDLDQKNVIWVDKNTPIIIDWEAARMVNPMQELFSVALDWSGLQALHVDMDIMKSFLRAYCQAGGSLNRSEIKPALLCVVGNWINWLVFNIERAANNGTADHEQRLSTEQVNKTLQLLHYLVPNMQELKNFGDAQPL